MLSHWDPRLPTFAFHCLETVSYWLSLSWHMFWSAKDTCDVPIGNSSLCILWGWCICSGAGVGHSHPLWALGFHSLAPCWACLTLPCSSLGQYLERPEGFSFLLARSWPGGSQRLPEQPMWPFHLPITWGGSGSLLSQDGSGLCHTSAQCAQHAHSPSPQTCDEGEADLPFVSWMDVGLIVQLSLSNTTFCYGDLNHLCSWGGERLSPTCVIS
jgi:hypothetical protein